MIICFTYCDASRKSKELRVKEANPVLDRVPDENYRSVQWKAPMNFETSSFMRPTGGMSRFLGVIRGFSSNYIKSIGTENKGGIHDLTGRKRQETLGGCQS